MSNTADSNGNQPVTFVGWQPGDTERPRKYRPRAHHKKSRAGCQQCRTRRVKCNEEHPICSNCQRQQTSCNWGRSPEPQSSTPTGLSTSKAYDISPKHLLPPLPPLVLPPQPDFPESKTRRLTELHLLYHYTTVTSSTFNIPNSKSQLWVTMIPPLAFKHDSLLYAICAVTSLHLSHLHPDDPSHLESYQQYLGLCLRVHRDDVALLNTQNADAAMLTATILRICSLAVLQTRGLEHKGKYVPPIEWLAMNFGTGHGLSVAAWNLLAQNENSVMRKMISNDTPGLDPSNQSLRDDKAIFASSNITPALSGLLHRSVENEIKEPWDEEIKKAYTTTVAYIGSCQQAIDTGEAEPSILRRVALFPAVVERSFITLVEEKRERALVVLACYFLFWRKFSGIWWCGSIGEREVQAISRAVGKQWEDLLTRFI